MHPAFFILLALKISVGEIPQIITKIITHIQIFSYLCTLFRMILNNIVLKIRPKAFF